MPTLTAPVSTADAARLTYIKDLTDKIRALQHEITDVAEDRRQVIISLRENRITYREIAEAMDVTEQAVYKILRDHLQRTDEETTPSEE